MLKNFRHRNPNEFIVGLFIVVPTIMLLMFIVVKLGYSLSGSTIDVYLKIDNLTTIKKGTSIKLKGYDVGKVVDLKPVYRPALHFLATMRIQKNIELHEDCSAIILNQNIIGDTVIELRNPYRKGKPLLEGDVIEGLAIVNLEELLKDVSKLLTTVTTTVEGFKQISLESRANVRDILANISGSTASINSLLLKSQGDILTTLSSFRDTARILNEISRELKKNPMKFVLSGKKDNGENKKKSKKSTEDVKDEDEEDDDE